MEEIALPDYQRRRMFGDAAALIAGASAAGAFAQSPSPSAGAVAAGTIRTVPSRDALSSLDASPGQVVFLAEPGREGLFICRAGRPGFSDPLQGLAVPARAGDRWFERDWDRTIGRPEWFGAAVNDWHQDSAAAIEACWLLCPVTQFAQADYFVRRTLRLATSFRTARGVGSYAADQDQGTRIILQGAAPGVHRDDILLVGSVTQPGRDNNAFPSEIHLAHFTLIRDGASAPHPSGDLQRYPTGLRASFLTRCTFAHIASLESSVGFYLGGLTYSKVDDCLAQRTRAGEGGGRDLAAGFYLDGRPEFGLAGGNASLYVRRCLAVGQHPGHVRPTGLLAEGAFVDSFIDQFESARIDTGMAFSARGATGPTQTVDLHVRNCVLDGCGATGIDLDLAGTSTASVEIIDPYVYAAGSGGGQGIAVRDGAGLVTLTGGQVHGDFRNGSLRLSNTRGVRVQGTKLHEGSAPVRVERSGGLVLEPQINNVVRATPAFAVTCTGVYRSSIRPIVIGAPGRLGGGVSFDTGCNCSSVDTTAVDPGCFAEVTNARKLWFGGQSVAGAGAAGFARQGNVVVGVTG